MRTTWQRGKESGCWAKKLCEIVVVLRQIRKEIKVTEGRADESVSGRETRKGLE